MGSEKKEVKKEPTTAKGAQLVDLSRRLRLRCLRPCYVSKHTVQEKKGGKHNPFHWVVNVAGYPFVNIAIQFRGKVGKYFQAQIRHHHPSAAIGPTCTFVIASESGTLGPAGFELVTFDGLRPMLPEVDIIAFSDNEEDFDVVAATIYATVA